MIALTRGDGARVWLVLAMPSAVGCNRMLGAFVAFFVLLTQAAPVSATATPSGSMIPRVWLCAVQSASVTTAATLEDAGTDTSNQRSANEIPAEVESATVDPPQALVTHLSKRTNPPPAGFLGVKREPRFSVGIRGGFNLPQNDLSVTTGSSSNFSIGLYGQYLLRGRHQFRPVGEWWYFSRGRQEYRESSRTQTINTRVRAVVVGGEYLYRFGGSINRFSLGGGVYANWWSIDSVDVVTFIPEGTVQASGNSHWIRVGEGLSATFRLSPRLELESRWVHSSYGYEHLPINVFILGAGWRF